MSKTASPAKISRPRLFDVVPRERLFELLDGNRGRPLIWIASPPGAGKTALIASYLEARSIPTVWYQVDASDTDPATFFHYLSLAVEPLREGDDSPLPCFVAEHLADLPAFARLYFRAFFARLPQGVVLVFDNYQEIPEDALLHDIVCQCVAETPSDSSVICVSRAEAPRYFVQFAARGAMVLVGWEKLQLTLDEVRAVSLRRGVGDEWLIHALHQQSQGWAAGVTLMLERLGHLDCSGRELPSDSRESVFNYFASLIFDRVPESMRHVLLSVAFLPQVTPALARELSGRPDAATVLEDLYRRRMFTDRRPGREPVYQFHALFQEFLRARARNVLPPKQFDALVGRTAFALQVADNVDAAISLWIAARDWQPVVQLIVKEAKGLLNSGRRQTLERWIGEVPESGRYSSPWLVYWLGCSQLQTRPEQGVKTLENALGLFHSAEDRRGSIACLTALLGGGYIGYAAIGAMDRWLDELQASSEEFSDALASDKQLQAWGALCCALIYVRPWDPMTTQALESVEELLPRCADAGIALTAAIGAVSACMLTGDLERGERILEQATELAERRGASPSEAAWWYCQVGYLKFVEAQYNDALRYLDKAIAIAESNALRSTIREIMLHRVTVECRTLGWARASATLTEIDALSRSSRPMNGSLYWLHQARRARFNGQSEQAVEFALAGYQAAVRSGARLWEMMIGLCVADLLIDAGRLKEAKPLIARSAELIGRTPVYDCYRAALSFVESWTALVAGDPQHATLRLREALGLAQGGTRRYYLCFLYCALPRLFMFALEEGIEVSVVQGLIGLFRLKPPTDAPENWPWPVRILTLGRFEVQVNGRPMEFSRKLPRKTLLLLKAIVAHGGRNVPEQVLCDALWGDEEADAALNALAITIVRLRKLLGTNEAVLYQAGRITLNAELCWVDTWIFEKYIADNGSAGRLLSIYRGAFLPDEEGEPWSVAARERLRGKFIDALSRYGATLEQQGDWQGAVQCYLRGIDADPIVETFHQGLMRCYERLGRRTEALSAYRRLKQTLSVVLGVAPSESTQQLFQTMLQRQSALGSGARERSSHLDAEDGTGSQREDTGNVVRKLPPRRRQVR